MASTWLHFAIVSSTELRSVRKIHRVKQVCYINAQAENNFLASPYP